MIITLIAAAVSAIVIPGANVRTATMIRADYPAALKRAGEQGIVVQRILVSPDGRALSCVPVQTIGNPLLGEASCKSFLRWRLDRPRGADGEPIHALIQPVTYFVSGSGPMSSIRRSADIQLRAQGVRESSQVLLYVQIGSNGRVLHCGNSKREDDPLVDAACVVAEDATWEVVHDQNGVAVPYVRHLHVQFDPDTDEGEGVANP